MPSIDQGADTLGGDPDTVFFVFYLFRAPDLHDILGYRLGGCFFLRNPSPLVGRSIRDASFRTVYDSAVIAVHRNGERVPGNRALDSEQKALRGHEIYWPYHQAIETRLDEFRLEGVTPALIAIHSFTPFFDQQARPWEIGVLWDRDPRIPLPLIRGLRNKGIVVGDNEPYSGKHPADFTIDHHGEEAGLPCVSIEIRQDLIATSEGITRWCRVLGDVLAEILLADDLFQPLRRETLI